MTTSQLYIMHSLLFPPGYLLVNKENQAGFPVHENTSMSSKKLSDPYLILASDVYTGISGCATWR